MSIDAFARLIFSDALCAAECATEYVYDARCFAHYGVPTWEGVVIHLQSWQRVLQHGEQPLLRGFLILEAHKRIPTLGSFLKVANGAWLKKVLSFSSACKMVRFKCRLGMLVFRLYLDVCNLLDQLISRAYIRPRRSSTCNGCSRNDPYQNPHLQILVPLSPPVKLPGFAVFVSHAPRIKVSSSKISLGFTSRSLSSALFRETFFRLTD